MDELNAVADGNIVKNVDESLTDNWCWQEHEDHPDRAQHPAQARDHRQLQDVQGDRVGQDRQAGQGGARPAQHRLHTVR